MPFNETACGLPAAPSVIVTRPLAEPLACGVKVTLIVQLAPPASAAGQLLVCAKGWLVAMLLRLRLAPPVFVNVTVWAALVVATICEPKLRLEVLSETAAGATPVALSDTLCGLPLAVSVIWRTPLKGPLAVGVKATVIWHDAPPARVPRQF